MPAGVVMNMPAGLIAIFKACRRAFCVHNYGCTGSMTRRLAGFVWLKWTTCGVITITRLVVSSSPCLLVVD